MVSSKNEKEVTALEISQKLMQQQRRFAIAPPHGQQRHGLIVVAAGVVERAEIDPHPWIRALGLTREDLVGANGRFRVALG